MKHISLFILVLFIVPFFSSCNKYLGPPDSITDPDAMRFIDSAGINNYSEQFAINNFVTQLKSSSLWTKFIAIYPMVGGTASTTKLNLKDPRDTDDAYRLTYYGNPVFAATGVLFSTSYDYADTHLTDNAIGGFNNASISYYSRTQNNISGYDMGCSDGIVPFNELSIYCNSSDESEWFGFVQIILSSNTKGLFMLSSSSTNIVRYRNGEIVSSNGSEPYNGYTNLTFLLGKTRVSDHPGKKECALATIGNGLTDAEALVFYNIVQIFENALFR